MHSLQISVHTMVTGAHSQTQLHVFVGTTDETSSRRSSDSSKSSMLPSTTQLDQQPSVASVCQETVISHNDNAIYYQTEEAKIVFK